MHVYLDKNDNVHLFSTHCMILWLILENAIAEKLHHIKILKVDQSWEKQYNN